MHTQSVIDHIRAASPKGTRNRYRNPSHRRDLIGRFMLLSTACLGILGLLALVTFLSV